MRAWHFAEATPDGSYVTTTGGLPVVVGETLRHAGPLVMCHSGLHASTDAMDALRYARGPVACRVECGGDVEQGDDKLVCRERTALWTYDATDVLRHFARLCALDVVGLWDAPPVVVRYLRGGNEALRTAAWDSARAAAWAATWESIRAAVRGAARAAARAAAWAAARDAARAAAQAAARDAAWDAAWAAVRDAARAAAWAADSAWAKQSRRLGRMLADGRPR